MYIQSVKIQKTRIFNLRGSKQQEFTCSPCNFNTDFNMATADLLILWTQLWFAYELCLKKYKIDSDFQSLEFFYSLSFPWVQQYSKTLILVSFVIISQTFHVCGFGVLLRSFVRNSLRGFVSYGMSVKFL